MTPEDCERRPHDVARLVNQQEVEIVTLRASLTREQRLTAAALEEALVYRKQRDEARGKLCEALALIPLDSAMPARYETAREVCFRLWPEDTDRLFPPKARL